MSDNRVLIFIGWAFVVSLACLDTAYSWPPIFGSIAIPAAFLVFRPKGELTRAVPRKEMWVGLSVSALVVGYLLYSGFSGATKVSNDWWHERPELRVYVSACTWLLLMLVGYRAFRAKYYPRNGSSPDSVGT